MAKFEGNYPAKPKEAPTWFDGFFENYALVIKFLNQAGKRGLNFSDNLLNFTSTVVVEHLTPVRITHPLGVTPTSINIQGGRYASYSIGSQNSTAVQATVRLLSTPCTDTENRNATTSIGVLDATLFKVGDSVLIQGQTRVITSIIGSRIGIDVAVLLQPPCVVNLNSDLLTFVLF